MAAQQYFALVEAGAQVEVIDQALSISQNAVITELNQAQYGLTHSVGTSLRSP